VNTIAVARGNKKGAMQDQTGNVMLGTARGGDELEGKKGDGSQFRLRFDSRPL
jgi:hypothetical protein